MVFKKSVLTKRVIAPLAFAWTLAAAGMAAVALSASPQVGAGPAGKIRIDDVQIGERGDQTRIAFICSAECDIEKQGGAFFLKAADASFDLDLSARGARVSAVRATPGEGGVLIDVTTDGVVEYAKGKRCTVGGRPAACLDLFFSEAEAGNASTPSEARRTQPNREAAAAGPALREDASEPAAASAAAPRLAMVKPALRETAEARLAKYAGFAPPERLAPPTGPLRDGGESAGRGGAILAKVQPIEKTIEVAKPSIRTETSLTSPARSDFAGKVRAILGKQLTPAFCNNAEATLQADAWALGAMVDVGLCAAARGDAAEADAMLARLLEFTPDNYEALVGRAIIAEQAHERGVARKYYQDALNALPPIEESNRIVQAMAELQN